MRPLLFAIAVVSLSVPTMAQEASRPQDSQKPYLTIITHSNWSKYPDEKRLVEIVSSEPMLSVAKRCHFNHYTTSEDTYKYRWAKFFPESSLPVVILQKSDGGYWYKASSENIPRTSQDLHDTMKSYVRLTPEIAPVNTQESEDNEYDEIDQDQEFRIRPLRKPNADDDEATDSYEMFGGKTPIRDTMANGATMLIAVVVVAMLLALITLGAIVLAIFTMFK